jgi:PAS domain S-box-containing protein
VYGILDIADDVTEEVTARKKMEETEANFRQLAEQMPQKIANADAFGNVFYYNKNWLEYTGLTMEERLGDGWINTTHPEELEKIIHLRKHSTTTGTMF